MAELDFFEGLYNPEKRNVERRYSSRISKLILCLRSCYYTCHCYYMCHYVLLCVKKISCPNNPLGHPQVSSNSDPDLWAAKTVDFRLNYTKCTEDCTVCVLAHLKWSSNIYTVSSVFSMMVLTVFVGMSDTALDSSEFHAAWPGFKSDLRWARFMGIAAHPQSTDAEPTWRCRY